MQKEEIINKFKKENEIIDERAKVVKGESYDIALIIMLFLWFGLSILRITDKFTHNCIGFLVMTTFSVSQIYQAIRLKTKTTIFFSISFTIFALKYLCFIIKG